MSLLRAKHNERRLGVIKAWYNPAMRDARWLFFDLAYHQATEMLSKHLYRPIFV
jgi:hypothetical protein